jgi:hypothetical protein
MYMEHPEPEEHVFSGPTAHDEAFANAKRVPRWRAGVDINT